MHQVEFGIQNLSAIQYWVEEDFAVPNGVEVIREEIFRSWDGDTKLYIAKSEKPFVVAVRTSNSDGHNYFTYLYSAKTADVAEWKAAQKLGGSYKYKYTTKPVFTSF